MKTSVMAHIENHLMEKRSNFLEKEFITVESRENQLKRNEDHISHFCYCKTSDLRLSYKKKNPNLNIVGRNCDMDTDMYVTQTQN